MNKIGQVRKERRYLSRNVIVDGVNRGLSVVTVDSDKKITVSSFEKETASTIWTDSAIIIENVASSPEIRFVAPNKIDLE